MKLWETHQRDTSWACSPMDHCATPWPLAIQLCDELDKLFASGNFSLVPQQSLYHHHHHHLRIVLTDRCAAPWPLEISILHRDESGIALASSWTRLSQVRRGWPGGLVQLVDGFLPSWLFTIKSKALFAGTSGSKRATWPKRDRRRLRRISQIVDKPVFWSSSTLVMLSICRCMHV